MTLILILMKILHLKKNESLPESFMAQQSLSQYFIASFFTTTNIIPGDIAKTMEMKNSLIKTMKNLIKKKMLV